MGYYHPYQLVQDFFHQQYHEVQKCKDPPTTTTQNNLPKTVYEMKKKTNLQNGDTPKDLQQQPLHGSLVNHSKKCYKKPYVFSRLPISSYSNFLSEKKKHYQTPRGKTIKVMMRVWLPGTEGSTGRGIDRGMMQQKVRELLGDKRKA